MLMLWGLLLGPVLLSIAFCVATVCWRMPSRPPFGLAAMACGVAALVSAVHALFGSLAFSGLSIALNAAGLVLVRLAVNDTYRARPVDG